MRHFNVLTSTLPGARPTPGTAAALPAGGSPNDPFAKVLKEVASGHDAEAAVPLAASDAVLDALSATGPVRPVKPAKSEPAGRQAGGAARSKPVAAPLAPDQTADLFALANAASQPMQAVAPSSEVAEADAPGPDGTRVAGQDATVDAMPPAVEVQMAALAAGQAARAAQPSKATGWAVPPPSVVTGTAAPAVAPSAVAAATVPAQAAVSPVAPAPPVSVAPSATLAPPVAQTLPVPQTPPAAQPIVSPMLSPTPAPDRGMSDPSAVAAASAAVVAPVVAAAASAITPKGPAPASPRASTVGATPQPLDETAAPQPTATVTSPLQAAASADDSAKRPASDDASKDRDEAIDAATSIAAAPAAPAPPPPVQQIVQALQGLGLDPAASGGGTGSSPSTAASSASAATATPTSSTTLGASGGTVTIQLDPEHLGRVQITLRMQAGAVDIRIDVDNAQTLTLLNKDKHILAAAVAATGRSSAIDLATGLAVTQAPAAAAPAIPADGTDPAARQHLSDPSSSGRGDRQGDQSPPSNSPENLRDDEPVSIGDRPQRRSDSSLYL